MKTSNLKEQTVEELRAKLADIKKNIFSFKFQKATGQLENTRAIRNLRKDVARIETILVVKEKNKQTEIIEDKKSGDTKKKAVGKK